MMAEVGDMLKVKGSKIATPFAPPSPGNTPIKTPRNIPINIKPKLGNVRATENPWARCDNSSIVSSPSKFQRVP